MKKLGLRLASFFFLDEFVGDQFARERRSGPVFVQFQVVAVINKPSRGGFLSERG